MLIILFLLYTYIYLPISTFLYQPMQIYLCLPTYVQCDQKKSPNVYKSCPW